MVHGVVLPQFSETLVQWFVVHAEMNLCVTHVTDDHSRGKIKSIAPHNEEINPQQDQRNERAGNGWHKNTLFIFRVCMVNAVNDVLKTFCLPEIFIDMKNVTVHEIFEKRPE